MITDREPQSACAWGHPQAEKPEGEGQSWFQDGEKGQNPLI
jgi:hypothetical protein